MFVAQFIPVPRFCLHAFIGNKDNCFTAIEYHGLFVNDRTCEQFRMGNAHAMVRQVHSVCQDIIFHNSVGYLWL